MEKSRFYKVFFLYGILLITNPSMADVTAEIFTKQGNQTSPIEWQFSGRWAWEKWKSSTEAFYYRIEVEIPSGIQVARVKGLRSHVSLDNKKQVMVIRTQEMLSGLYVKLSNGKTLKWFVRINLAEQFMFVEGCEPFNLYFKLDKIKKPPFFIGAKCVANETNVRMHLSVSPRVEWLSTSVAESEGKGESSRVFEVKSDLVGANDIVANFTLGYGKEALSLDLAIKKVEPKKNYSKFKVSLGWMLHDLQKKSGAQSSAGLPVLAMAYDDRADSEKWHYGVDVLVSLPSLDKSKYVKYSEVLPFIGYTFGMEGSWWLEPRAYVQLGDGISSPASYFYNFNFAGGGISLTKHFLSGSGIFLDTMIGSNGEEFQGLARLSYARARKSKKDKDKKLSWGITLGYEMIILKGLDPTDIAQMNLMLDIYL